MGFWDTFRKVTAVGTAAGAAVGATALGVNLLVNSNRKRKMNKQQMEIEERKQSQTERKDLIEREIRLKELELQQKQMQANAYVDLAKTQMNTQANIQTTSIKGDSDVKKTEAMYGAKGINSNAMFYDKENGVMVDNRNVSLNAPAGMGLMGINYTQPSNSDNMNISDVQQKLLDANSLLKSGAISQEDFNQIKSKLLSQAF